MFPTMKLKWFRSLNHEQATVVSDPNSGLLDYTLMQWWEDEYSGGEWRRVEFE